MYINVYHCISIRLIRDSWQVAVRENMCLYAAKIEHIRILNVLYVLFHGRETDTPMWRCSETTLDPKRCWSMLVICQATQNLLVTSGWLLDPSWYVESCPNSINGPLTARFCHVHVASAIFVEHLKGLVCGVLLSHVLSFFAINSYSAYLSVRRLRPCI